MSLEEENKEKRKEMPLTREEWLTFFFFPVKAFSRVSDEFFKTEQKRFKDFGFDKKRKQANEAKFFGILFYINLTLIIIVLVK